jgi:hypothetical protein
LEQMGDIESARGNLAEARVAYNTALAAAPDRATKKRIRQRVKAVNR